MRFEFTSRFRNRKAFPRCGAFAVEAIPHSGSHNAVDPVCAAAPIISWNGGFSYAGTITQSVLNETHATVVVTFGALDVQAATHNFLAGCILTPPSCRVLESKYLSGTTLELVIPGTPPAVGAAVTVADYTSYSTLNVRCPTNLDLGQFSILYNERLNTFLNIDNIDLETRQFAFTQTSAPGWLDTDSVNVRDAPPGTIATILFATTTSVTLTNVDPSWVGDWIRLRLATYATATDSASWFRQVSDVVGNVVTFFPALAVAPAGTVEHLRFSYDNYNPVQIYEYARTRPYNVSLDTLVIPNTSIIRGTLSSIPYLVVELHNDLAPMSNRNLINSNNPFVVQGVWIVKLDTLNCKRRFITANVEQRPQTLVLDIRDRICIIIKLPNGAILATHIPDTHSPRASLQDLNVWLTFNFEASDGEM